MSRTLRPLAACAVDLVRSLRRRPDRRGPEFVETAVGAGRDRGIGCGPG
jgi:hypothetical protein